jgi:hypothetical protein
MTKTTAEALKIGDKIMPPAREVQLWMRRACQEKGLPESAMALTIKEIYEGATDKRGRWLIINADQTPEWSAGCRLTTMRFKVRPETPWTMAA